MHSELLSVQPNELMFPFELNKQILCSLRLVNLTEDHVAFKVILRSAIKYRVHPDIGVVLPQSSIDVTVTMKARRKAPPNLQCKDKLLILSIKAPSGLSANDISPELFKKAPKRNINKIKLRALYASPPQPPSQNSKEVSELKAKLTEARTALTSLSEEWNAALSRYQLIQQKLTIKNADLEELREVGSGTFATVYHGKWRGADVAIKRIKNSCFMGNPSEQERMRADFWREACILAQLRHPNVVAFYGIVPDGPGGTLATVTEYMVHGSLKQILQDRYSTFNHQKRLIILMEAAFGMEYLHSKNIVHFDLKCENLLVNMRDPQQPICKVGDLGLSKIKHQTFVSGGWRGTLPWMAPELLHAIPMVSEKVDVFSFGIVMWELLTGEEPYANMDSCEIIRGIFYNTLRPLIPNACNPSWRSLMESCWSEDPSMRPTFTEIISALRAMAAMLQAQ